MRAAVRNDDFQRLEDVRESIDSFGATLEYLKKSINSFRETQIQLKDFQDDEEYEGPLGLYLPYLEPFPECGRAVKAVRDFQKTALDFKGDMYGAFGSTIATLHDMVEGHGHWSETKRTDPTKYAREKAEGLEDVRDTYKAAIIELEKVTIAQLGSVQK